MLIVNSTQSPEYMDTTIQEQGMIDLHEFDQNELDANDMIDSKLLHFIPQDKFEKFNPMSLDDLRTKYFGRKNHACRRFEYKLWNALLITTVYPNLIPQVGVCWVNDNIIKVYKQSFAKLMNINHIDGGLFHKQGNFTRHGFVICEKEKVMQEIPQDQLEDVDFKNVVLVYHKENTFTKNSTEDEINSCKWDNPSPRTRIANIHFNNTAKPAE